MSNGAKRLARSLAAVVVRECRTEADVAALLYPVCLQADASRTLRRELRKAAARRERIIRHAARPPQRTGYADLIPGRFATVLTETPRPQAVNGHHLDVSVSPAELFRPREEHGD